MPDPKQENSKATVGVETEQEQAVRTCARCGREGTRGFTRAVDGRIVCAARAACAKRSNRLYDGTPRGSRYLVRGVTGSTS